MKIIEMYNDSIPLNKISEYLSMTLEDLLNFLEQNIENFQYKGASTFTQNHKKNILIQYVDFNKSSKVIAQEFGHCSKTVQAIIRENNIEPRSKGTGKLSESDIIEIIDMQSNGLYATEIAPKFNVAPSSILRRLKNHGIALRQYKPTPKSQESARKHHFNKRFFREIDSEGSAYGLFLFATDGHFKREEV